MDQTLNLQETDDGDLFFELPDELLDQLGWEDGTELEFAIVGDSVRITRVLPEQSGVAGDVSVLPGVD